MSLSPVDPTMLLNMGGGGFSTVSSADYDKWSSAQKSGYWSALTQNLSRLRAGKGSGDPYSNAAEVALLVGVREQLDIAAGDIKSSGTLSADFISALTAALVSKDVYYDYSIPELLPRGVTRITGDADLLSHLGLSSDLLVNPESGFFAGAYQLGDSGNYLIANRGTEFTEENDWFASLYQGLGQFSAQYDQAMRVAVASTRTRGSQVSFTGHSLGGGLASAQALAVRGSAITFNSSGLHANTVSKYGITLEEASQYVRSYHVKGELLSTAQDSGKYFFAAGAAGVGGVAGTYPGLPHAVRYNALVGGGTLATMLTQMPVSVGHRTGLVPREAPRMGAGGQGWLPGGNIMPLAIPGRSAELHGISQVVFALYGASGLDASYRSAIDWTPPPSQPIRLPPGAQFFWPPIRADGKQVPVQYGGKR